MSEDVARLTNDSGPWGTTGFDEIVVTLGGSYDSGLAIAAARAGACGLLDLTNASSAIDVEQQVKRLFRLASSSRFGLLLDADLDLVAIRALEAVEACDTILLSAHLEENLTEAIDRCRKVARRVGLVVVSAVEARSAADCEVDFLVAKGHEAGGPVGEETTFVLLQHLLACQELPVYAWGGIGLCTAAACRVAGAAGIVLDWQLSLTRESPLDKASRRRIAAMDGSETIAVRVGEGRYWRIYRQAGASVDDEMRQMAERTCLSTQADRQAWRSWFASRSSSSHMMERVWPVGQDACFAAHWHSTAPTVARALTHLRQHVESCVTECCRSPILRRGSPLAASHSTEFPIVQGPMTRVSDVPEFCQAVEQHGALPFLALALMRGPEVRKLLENTRDRMSGRPWGVGILGFVPQALRDEQTGVIEEFVPTHAIIAGGRPDQAAALEGKGIATYLHVPSPAMLEGFLREGARRFIFEGRECGGHVGPRTSFVLWESMVAVLLQADLTPDEAQGVHVLFAGGIHDGLSAAMVSALAQPLVDRSMKVGVLLGTAYLFTEEIVQTGATVSMFQNVTIEADRTVLVETGPGHAIRCADTHYTNVFESESSRLRKEQQNSNAVRDELERMNMGRLRIASKGVVRAGSKSIEVDTFDTLPPHEQRQQGMYMMGQIAALRSQRTTIRQLHEDVCDGAEAWLKRASTAVAMQANVQPPSSDPPPFDVAIVGMGCMVPGALNLAEFWQNVLMGEDKIGEIPRERFDYRRWFDADPSTRDHINSKWGGFLPDLPFDPIRFGIPPAAMTSIEPMQLLALLLVEQALEDAGYRDENPHARRTSVILGVGGGAAELGGHYAFRSLLPRFFEGTSEQLLSELPEWSEDSFAGILLNVVAGRVSNRFDLGGANFTVDAACASSLAAIYLACRELADGSADMVIAGGCDTMQSPFGYLCFSKTGALSPRGRSRTFDATADGIAISEGHAAVVLKRRADAERDGDRIYAVIRAVAGASDGRCLGLTAPRQEGQQHTLERAYAQARINPRDVGLFEAHGTGTTIGDRAEGMALTSLLNAQQAPAKSSAIGSVKSIIGHTKCTAGVIGLIKATLALYHRVLPPTLHVEQPNAAAGLQDGPLYVNSELRPWIREAHPRRAGVSAFGFGGSNFHAVLEEYEGCSRLQPCQAASNTFSAELLTFRSASVEGLATAVAGFAKEVSETLAAADSVSLAELAYTLHVRQEHASAGSCRAAIVARNLDDLPAQLSRLRDHLAGVEGAEQLPPGIVCCEKDELLGGSAAVAFLCPGQGAQFPNMLKDLAIQFREVSDCFARADAVLADRLGEPLSRYVFPPPAFSDLERASAVEALKQTDRAQVALGVADVAMLRLLDAFGVRAQMVAGHSYGELVALHAAGCIDEETLYQLSAARGRAVMAAVQSLSPTDAGTMLAVSGDEALVRQMLADCPQVVIANQNSPQQTVISGGTAAMQQAAERLHQAGLQCHPISVACAFHSPLVAVARDRFLEELTHREFCAPRIKVYNNTTAQPYGKDQEAIKQQLAEQLVREVRFADQIRNMYEQGARVFIEAGPNRVLSRFVRETLEGSPHLCVATGGVPDSDGLVQLLMALAELFAQGVPLQLSRLYEGRELRLLDLGQIARSTGTEQAAHVWLVNGSYARPAGEPARLSTPRFQVHLADEGPPTPESGRPSADAPSTRNIPTASIDGGQRLAESHDVHDDVAYVEFQKTMREFLATQEAVMQAYFRDGTSADVSFPNQGDQSPNARMSEPEQVVQPSHAVDTPSDLVDGEAAGSSTDSVTTNRDVLAEAVTEDAEEFASRDEDDLLLTLTEIISKRTGYPVDMLDLDASLEGELGIDSIKRVEIISAFRRHVTPGIKEPPNEFMERLTGARSIRDILNCVVDFLQTIKSAGPDAAAQDNSNEPSSFDTDLVGTKPTGNGECPRCVAVAIETPIDIKERFRPASGVFVVTDDGRGVASALMEELTAAGVDAVMLDTADLGSAQQTATTMDGLRSEYGRISGVAHLLPLRDAPDFPGVDRDEWLRYSQQEVTGMLYLLQALSSELKLAAPQAPSILCASRGGGDFTADDVSECRHPWRGGIAGLLKVAQCESEAANFRLLDVDELPEPSVLLKELADRRFVEIGYRAGRRYRLDPKPKALDLRSTTAAKSTLNSQSVVLVTGGARGITAQIAEEFAQRTKARFVLLGRTQIPEHREGPLTEGIEDKIELRKAILDGHQARGVRPSLKEVEDQLGKLLAAREIRRNVAAIGVHAEHVEYIPCDVRDQEALTRVVQDVQSRLGRVHAVLHGAGVIEDRYIEEKTTESFERVISTKVDPLLTFSRLLDPARLELLMLFSSTSGFFGNPGQCDYACANETLNRIARRLDRVWPGKVVAMNWGPWTGAGMVADEVARQFKQRGIGMVTVPQGRLAAWQEAASQHRDGVRIITGPGPWVTVEESPPESTIESPENSPLLSGLSIQRLSEECLEVKVSLDGKLPYLNDHRIDGKPVLPLAVAAGMMAELVAAAEPGHVVARLTDLQQFQGVIVDGSRQSIWIQCQRQRERDAVDRVWRARIVDDKASPRDCYEVNVHLAPHFPEPPTDMQWPVLDNGFPYTVRDAYLKWMFHGPSLRLIQEFHGVNQSGIDATLRPSLPSDALGPQARGSWLIDPIALDVAPQMAGFWSRARFDVTPLPNRIESLSFYAPLGTQPLRCSARMREGSDGNEILADVWYVRDGRVVTEILGLECAGTVELNRITGVLTQ